MSEEYREIVEGEVKVLVKKPTRKDYNQSQIVYNKVWAECLQKNAYLRQELNDILEKKGLWSKEKQEKYDQFIQKINNLELILKKGGIPLKKAKSIAIDLKNTREEFRDLISVRTAYDNNTAEGTADNARFDYLVSVCVLDPSTKSPVFKDIEDYNERGAEPWAVKAAGELANLLYNLDQNYEKNLPENDFLKKFKFVNDEGRLVNKDGHLIAIDEDGVERLIDKDNYFIAYDENGKSYRVNKNGEPTEVEQLPFTDDDGNPINDEAASQEEAKKTKKKKDNPAE
jgi:hypothetical protein